MKHVAEDKKNDGRWKTSVWTDEESVAFLNLEHKTRTHPHTLKILKRLITSDSQRWYIGFVFRDFRVKSDICGGL